MGSASRHGSQQRELVTQALQRMDVGWIVLRRWQYYDRQLSYVSQTLGYQRILDAASPFLDKIAGAGDEADLSELLGQARDKIDYSGGRQTRA